MRHDVRRHSDERGGGWYAGRRRGGGRRAGGGRAAGPGRRAAEAPGAATPLRRTRPPNPAPTPARLGRRAARRSPSARRPKAKNLPVSTEIGTKVTGGRGHHRHARPTTAGQGGRARCARTARPGCRNAALKFGTYVHRDRHRDRRGRADRDQDDHVHHDGVAAGPADRLRALPVRRQHVRRGDAGGGRVQPGHPEKDRARRCRSGCSSRPTRRSRGCGTGSPAARRPTTARPSTGSRARSITVRIALDGHPAGQRPVRRHRPRAPPSTIGRKFVMKVDNTTKQMTVYKDGELVRTMPVSLGKKSTPSSSGTMVIMEKQESHGLRHLRRARARRGLPDRRSSTPSGSPGAASTSTRRRGRWATRGGATCRTAA